MTPDSVPSFMPADLCIVIFIAVIQDVKEPLVPLFMSWQIIIYIH